MAQFTLLCTETAERRRYQLQVLSGNEQKGSWVG
jgi:hypothetical protein